LKLSNEKDFMEGVRFALVDKSTKPKWTHNNIFEFTEKELESYFSMPPMNVEELWEKGSE